MAETHDAYTKLMLHFEGADESATFTDEIGNTLTTYGTAQIDTAQARFGAASGLFDGNSDYLRLPYSADFNLSGNDWTIDAWFRAISFAAAQAIIVKDKNGSAHDWSIAVTDNRTLACWTNEGLTGYRYIVTTPTMSVDTWYHVALVRAAGTVHFYLDGIEYGAGSAMAFSNKTTEYVTVGCAGWNSPNTFMNGWIDELRVSNGIARWTAGFVPPTMAYPQAPPACYLGRRIDRFDMRPVSMRNCLLEPKTPSHTKIFTASEEFASQTMAPHEILVVGGGGGGGGSSGTSIGAGGGGAGGVLSDAAYLLPAGETVVAAVGLGGSGPTGFASGGSGGNSVFGTLTALGGGGGGSWQKYAQIGGSGGGAGENNDAYRTGAAGTAGQGNAGGSTSSAYASGTQSSGAGGGGKGGAGANTGSNVVGGNGGVGEAYTIADGVTAVYYGGGGGGAGSTTKGTGGNGGGGDGRQGTTGPGSAGTDGLGGGGGGALTLASEAAQAGGNGGRGVVIVRWVASFLTDPFSDISPVYGGTPPTGIPMLTQSVLLAGALLQGRLTR